MLTFKKLLITFSIMPLMSFTAMAEGVGSFDVEYTSVKVLTTIKPAQMDRHIPLTETDSPDATYYSTHHRSKSDHNLNREGFPLPTLEIYNRDSTEKGKERKNEDVSQHNKHQKNIKLKPN